MKAVIEMRCEKCSEMLSAYLDGELEKQEMCEMTEHLRQCAGCEKLLREMTGLQERFSGLFLELPERDFLEQRVLEKLPPKRTMKSLPQFSLRMASVLAGLLFSALLLLLFSQSWHPFFRLMLKVLGQIFYVPLLLLADKPFLQWSAMLGAIIALAALGRLLLAKTQGKEKA